MVVWLTATSCPMESICWPIARALTTWTGGTLCAGDAVSRTDPVWTCWWPRWPAPGRESSRGCVSFRSTWSRRWCRRMRITSTGASSIACGCSTEPTAGGASSAAAGCWWRGRFPSMPPLSWATSMRWSGVSGGTAPTYDPGSLVEIRSLSLYAVYIVVNWEWVWSKNANLFYNLLQCCLTALTNSFNCLTL